MNNQQQKRIGENAIKALRMTQEAFRQRMTFLHVQASTLMKKVRDAKGQQQTDRRRSTPPL
ncbi:MAG: hypothetical protein AAB733_02785 [Patescibacteria group bacterium]